MDVDALAPAALTPRHDTDLFVSIYVNPLLGTSLDAVESYHFGRHSNQGSLFSRNHLNAQLPLERKIHDQEKDRFAERR